MQITNYLKNPVILIVFIAFQICTGQSNEITDKNDLFIIPEIIIGKTMEANTFFPKTKAQKGFFFSVGRYNKNTDKEWVSRLNYPKTGLTLGYTDFGNADKIGKAYTIMPFMEFSVLKQFVKGLNFQISFGGSYMDTQYDPNTNAFNTAITTKINWSFKSFLYYNLFKQSKTDWRFGLGYLHHSNGHTSLPNEGLNSFAASVSVKLDPKSSEDSEVQPATFKSKSEMYFAFRFGVGQNVLSDRLNAKKEVYILSASLGKIINNTFKFGAGFYYRFYEHYYDYIKNNETVVEEQFPHFRENPFGYATNFGLFVTSELLLDHFGFECDIGLNVYKPFYKIDRLINKGYSFTNDSGEFIEVVGELDWYFEFKRTVTARMGLKYYFWSTNKRPKYNMFIGAHINSNLGQADFTELTLGFVHRFNFKEKNI